MTTNMPPSTEATVLEDLLGCIYALVLFWATLSKLAACKQVQN